MHKLFTLLLLCLAITTSIFAQKITVQGIIKSTDGTSQPGVNVKVKGATTGTVSDINGNYSISVESTDVLVYSFIGFETVEMSVNGNTKINVILKEASEKLDEVVITAFGIKKEKARLGYSVQEVEGKELVKARDQNPISGLTGKVAGLSVGPSAELLRKPTVMLRGGEVTLYVVDGVPVSSDTWNISPDDIESMSVLKGPTAAALYGSRAQNGAILITTKKGLKHNGVSVEFNSTNVVDQGFLAFPRTQKDYGGGENCIYAFGDGNGGGLNDADYDVWGPKFRGQLIPQYDGAKSTSESYTTTFGDKTYTGNIEPTPYLRRGSDNLKNFMQVGFQTTNNLSVTATGDNYNMRFSLSHSYQSSIIPNNYLNITNLALYGSYNVNKDLKVEANINFNRQYTDNFPDVNYGPNSLIYNVSIWTGADWDVNDPKIKAIWQDGKEDVQSLFCEYTRYHNPWLMVKKWLRGHYKTDIDAYVSANYKINNIFNVNLRSQVSTYSLLRTEKMPYSAHPYGREGNMGDYREDRRDLYDNNTDLQLNFNYTNASSINFSGLIGGNIRTFTYNSNFTSTDYLNVPTIYSFSNSKNELQSTSFNSSMAVYSGYGSMDVTFNKYGTLSLTARMDKSTALLPSSNTSYFYPSVSVSSVLNQYLKLPEIISYLKIRASYAAVRAVPTSETIGTAPFNTITSLGGSASSDIYGYPLDYGSNYYTPYGGPTYALMSKYTISKEYNSEASASYTDNLIDQDIKASNRINYEGGFDLKVLHDRLGLNATVFEYIDGPQILNNTISSASGYTGYYINALKTKMTGMELTFTGTPVKTTRGFKWDATLNWDTHRQTYLELPDGQDTYNTFWKKGDRIDKLYSSAFVRDPNGNIIYSGGTPLSKSVSQFLGYQDNKYRWALINKVSYKNVSLMFQFDGAVGGKMIDYMHNKTMRGGANIETAEGALGAAREIDDQYAGVTSYAGSYIGDGVAVSNGASINYDSKTGDVTNYDELEFIKNTTPALVQAYCSKYYGVSEANLMSKTFSKLREVTLSYDLPASWLSKTRFSRVTLSLVGRNLFYFYGDKRFKDVDLDQYNYSTASTGLQSPTTRRYGFNVNVTF
jgi:TonB-linked SusC/RagA family outer membrane protein